MTTTALTIRQDQTLSITDIMADFANFLWLHTADGDASPATIRSYYGKAGQFVAWCTERGINPAMATEDDIAVYRRELVAQYKVGTVAVKLAAIRRLYEAAVWRGLRQDKPAAGLRAPKDRTARAERMKFLPLEGLRRLLDAREGDGALAVRDRAILALMGRSLDRVHRGGGMSARAVRYMVDGYLEALDLKAAGISCHSLRHSAAMWARAGGAELDALADMMRHADVSTARIHAQIVNKMTENPAQFLEAMLRA